ncbi:MAG: hypothetical protein Kow00107_05890 [Planctomycetota bacterium]
MAEEYLDFAQALDALEISETELWELIHSGTLKAYRAGGVIKFKKSDIIAYQKSRGTEPTIVVSRKMLDSMDEQDAEEGIDTEVGLRAARRPSQDDMATSEITVKESAVRRRGEDSEETAPVTRRSSQKTDSPTARGSVRSKRISQVLETEKKGNPIMNVVMIVACLLLIYHALVQITVIMNDGETVDGRIRIIRPAWVSAGMMDSGLNLGAGSNAGTVREDIRKYGIKFDYEGDTEDSLLIKQVEEELKARAANPSEETPGETETPEETPEETPAE